MRAGENNKSLGDLHEAAAQYRNLRDNSGAAAVVATGETPSRLPSLTPPLVHEVEMVDVTCFSKFRAVFFGSRSFQDSAQEHLNPAASSNYGSVAFTAQVSSPEQYAQRQKLVAAIEILIFLGLFAVGTYLASTWVTRCEATIEKCASDCKEPASAAAFYCKNDNFYPVTNQTLFELNTTCLMSASQIVQCYGDTDSSNSIKQTVTIIFATLLLSSLFMDSISRCYNGKSAFSSLFKKVQDNFCQGRSAQIENPALSV